MNLKNTNMVKNAIYEDLGSGDITASLIPTKKELIFQLLAREHCILCGIDWFNESFKQLDPNCSIEWQAKDSDPILENSIICTIKGNAKKLLTAERTALNFLQTLSGTATVTNEYAQLIQHTKCRLLDTRKTIPLLRDAQKYAVSCGGGVNHRMGLYDAFLIKENHIAASKSITDAVLKARAINPDVLLEVEVETLEQLEEVIDAKADRVLLDNFSSEQLKRAVNRAKGIIQLEASGNISKENIVEIAETGVDFISIGAVTKHLKAIDFSLRFAE